MLTIAIRCKKFQLVSGTNHFGGFVFKFVFQVLPIVPILCIIVLFINSPHNIKHRKPPLGFFLVPNGSNLTVVVETDG